MPGSVFVYNLFNEKVNRLSLNGSPALSPAKTDASEIAAWGGPATGYMPSHVEVGSAIHDDEDSGYFYRGGNGANDLRIDWDSGFATNHNFVMPTVSDDISIDENLLCFIAINDSPQPPQNTRAFALVMSVKGHYIKYSPLTFVLPAVF